MLHARVRILRPHLRTNAALASVMDDRHRRQMAHLPAGLLDAQAQIRLLAVDEESLVEVPSALERLAPREHERTGRPVAVDGLAVSVELKFALAKEVGAQRQ